MLKNGLIKKIRLISKFLKQQTGKHTIVIHTLPNISKNKGNQIMKSGQLIEYIMKNIILVNYQYIVRKT